MIADNLKNENVSGIILVDSITMTHKLLNAYKILKEAPLWAKAALVGMPLLGVCCYLKALRVF